MKRTCGSFLAALALVCVGWGQNPPADAPADKEDVQKLFVALHLGEMMQNVMTTSMQQQKQVTHDVLKKKMPSMREDEFRRMDAFIDEFSKTFGKRIEEVPADNMAALQRYSWPGNIRELRNAIERAMILASSPRLTIAIPTPLSVARLPSLRLVDIQKDHIKKVLETSGWRVRGLGGAADRLGLRPTTLETRMAKLSAINPSKANLKPPLTIDAAGISSTWAGLRLSLISSTLVRARDSGSGAPGCWAL